MTKEKTGVNAIERCCRMAGMTPEKRVTNAGHDIFIADGFCDGANVYRWVWRMGVNEGEFPNGCYCTIWWVAKGEDDFQIGVPLFFDAFHDPQFGTDAAMRKRARINTALKEADGWLKRVKRYRQDGFSIN